MILPIVKYGHPVLRKKGERIERVTPEIRQLIEDMLETMEANQGVGLAAQQIGQFLHMAGHGGPFGDGRIDFGGTKGWPDG